MFLGLVAIAVGLVFVLFALDDVARHLVDEETNPTEQAAVMAIGAGLIALGAFAATHSK
jgi:hypothetical protein